MNDSDKPAVPENTAPHTLKERPLRPWFLIFFGRWEWLLVVLLALAIALNASLSPYFLNATNLARNPNEIPNSAKRTYI